MRSVALVTSLVLVSVGCSGTDGGVPSSSSGTAASVSGSSTGAGGAGGAGGGSGGDAIGAGGMNGAGGAGGTGGTSATSSSSGGPMGPDFDDIPWTKGTDVGYGIARKDTQNPLGDAAFIGYGGYGVSLDDACAWTRELYLDDLAGRGVRFVYCVQGPSNPSYSALEIGNSKIAKHLVATLPADAPFIAVAAHSSGSFVAHELFAQLAGSLDPASVTAGRIVYFDLDGGQSGLTNESVAYLRKAYFVGARDLAKGTKSPNHATMTALGNTYASMGGFLELDATNAGCDAGATWCVHMVPITSKPHDAGGSDVDADYTDFAGRPVVTTYLTATEVEAGLTP